MTKGYPVSLDMFFNIQQCFDCEISSRDFGELPWDWVLSGDFVELYQDWLIVHVETDFVFVYKNFTKEYTSLNGLKRYREKLYSSVFAFKASLALLGLSK